MSRYTGPKNKLARRIGEDLGLKTSSAKVQRRLTVPPGQHGRKGGGKKSNYGIQLQEKQKVRWMYGIQEKQFRRYIKQAEQKNEETGAAFLRLLELRLDNVVYRMGIAPTRAAARQLVNHGHVQVNGKKVDIASYQVDVGDSISFSSKALNIPAVSQMIEQKVSAPAWLEVKQQKGTVVDVPTREHIDAHINESLIIEFYSR